MNSLLFRASSLYFIRHPAQLVLALLGIALGVAVVVAVDLAKDSALESFDQATTAIAGRATHRIIAGPSGLNESLYRTLVVEQRLYPAAPKVEGYVSFKGKTFQLLGIDPFAEGPFQTSVQSDQFGQNGVSNRFLTTAGLIGMTDSTAKRLALNSGDALVLQVGARTVPAKLYVIRDGLSKLESRRLNNIFVTDIATAQEILGMTGRLSHIDLMETSNNRTALIKIREWLPKTAELIDYRSEHQQIHQMTGAFYSNLSALSLLSLLVAFFLIYNTITFMVVQRRQLFGKLRAIGVTRRQVFQLILVEAGIVGGSGTIIGLIAGIALGHGLLGFIVSTIDQLYLPLSSSQLSVSGITLIKGTLLGLGSALVAGIIPANEATRIPPLQAQHRSHLEIHAHSLSTRLLPIGFSLILLGALMTVLPSSSTILGFGGLFVVILGCALMTPQITIILTNILSPLVKHRFGIMGLLPVRSLAASLSRTGVAMAALMVAIAVTIGMTLMISSFRLSVTDWLNSRINADFYVAAPTTAKAQSNNGLSKTLLIRLKTLTGVESVGSVRRVQIETSKGTVSLSAYQLPARAKSGFHFLAGEPGKIWSSFEYEDTVILSEAYAYHHTLDVGSITTLRTYNGQVNFKVVGIYSDYNVGQGVIAMSRSTYNRHWYDNSYSSFWVYTLPDANFEQIETEIRQSAPKNIHLKMTTNKEILDISLALFDQSFAIAGILRLLAAIIAFIGVFTALTALQLDRTQEYGVLRATGVTPRQLRKLVLTETGVMGFLAGFLAIPVGFLIAVLLVYTVNQRTFGWTMALHFDWGNFLQPMLLAIIAALLAGIYPAIKMSQTKPAEALRNE